MVAVVGGGVVDHVVDDVHWQNCAEGLADDEDLIPHCVRETVYLATDIAAAAAAGSCCTISVGS